MKRVGVRKGIDKLGRMVIPKEMRELFGLERQVELIVVPGGCSFAIPNITSKKTKKQKNHKNPVMH